MRWEGGAPVVAAESLVNTAFVAPAAWKTGATIGVCSTLYARSNESTYEYRETKSVEMA